MKGRQHIGRRLLRNKGAFFGLIVIGAAIVVALTAYYISPDPSPDANRIIVEIGGRQPGFTQQFVLLKKAQPPPTVSFFHRLLYGREDEYDYIPISSYTAKKDSIIAEKFVDEGVFERRAYPIGAVADRVEERRFWLGTDKYG